MYNSKWKQKMENIEILTEGENDHCDVFNEIVKRNERHRKGLLFDH